MTQKKKVTKRNAKKKVTKTKPKKKSLELNPNQNALLKTLAGEKKFTANKSHRMTQQSLIDRDLAVTDKSGTKIKATALGRKYAKKI